MKTKVVDSETRQFYWADEPGDLYEGEAFIRPPLGIRTIAKISYPDLEYPINGMGFPNIYQTIYLR